MKVKFRFSKTSKLYLFFLFFLYIKEVSFQDNV